MSQDQLALPSSLPQFSYLPTTEGTPTAAGPVPMALPPALSGGTPPSGTVGDPRALHAAFAHYAADAAPRPAELPPLPTVDPLPPNFVGPPSRDDLVRAQKEKLTQGMGIVAKLPEAQRDAYLQELLKDTARFSAGMHGEGGETDTKTGLPPRYAVPPELIQTVRPLISQIERPGTGRTTAGDAEAARDGTTIDWNSQLGVPQYRTQSDNLMTPEGSCNLTTLAMMLERVGYNRADALRAVDRKLKRDFLKKEHAGEAVCVMDSDADIDKMKMPDGLFEKTVEGYLHNQMSPGTNGSAYQRLRGEGALTEAEIKRLAAQYRDNAQFEDTLDLLRTVQAPGMSRTQMSSGVPDKILQAIEPDPSRRPTLKTLQAGTNNWDGVRKEMDDTLHAGGAGMVSFRHKGSTDRKGGTHIISVQNVEEGGVRFDDPYGHINDTYRVNKPGDAYGETGSTTRSANFKNQVYGNDNRGDGVVGNDWKAEQAQALTAGESLGDSTLVPNAVHQNSFGYARTMRPKTKEEIAAADAENYVQLGLLRIPKHGLPNPGR